MLKEAFAYLFDSAREQQKAKLLEVPGDGRTAYVDQAGTLKEIKVSPPLRGHRVESVVDLVAAAKKWNTAPVVWVSESCVVLITDDGDRRERVTMGLKLTDQFAFLVDAQRFDQPEMIRALRVNLPGAEKRAELIAAIRSLKWRTSTSGTADLQHGNESLGKTVENEVTGAGTIPELVTVSTAVFSNPGEEKNEVTIGCDLEIDAPKQKFLFRPLPDELRAAKAKAVEDIRARIARDLPEVTVLYGTP